ncbi:MAG: leucyl/phenylalanyl-tRNA--protein transferase [Salinarimonadaceae bacterium]|nr:MAG: leucyl/phenylalanyl-tRNA--protein transferase [Salinarimonadaceae bacterium]
MGGDSVEITPDILLRAYAAGVFPMAESADDPGIFWVEPRERGVIPLDTFHVGRRLARTVRSDAFSIRFDCDFESVIAGCAEPAPDREQTWINQRIRDLYGELFRLGRCHTVEAYLDGELVGGLYGVDIGGAFFGESMFHRVRDASKVALVHLVARLRHCGYTLLDTQFVTGHLSQFGATEVPRRIYRVMLSDAIAKPADWTAWPQRVVSGAEALAIIAAPRP